MASLDNMKVCSRPTSHIKRRGSSLTRMHTAAGVSHGEAAFPVWSIWCPPEEQHAKDHVDGRNPDPSSSHVTGSPSSLL